MSKIYKTSFSLKEETRALLTSLQAQLQLKENKDISKSDVIFRALVELSNTLELERESKNE